MLILRTWSLMEGHVARLLSASPSRLPLGELIERCLQVLDDLGRNQRWRRQV